MYISWVGCMGGLYIFAISRRRPSAYLAKLNTKRAYHCHIYIGINEDHSTRISRRDEAGYV